MVIHDLWSMRGDHKHSIVANARNNHSYIKRNKCLRIAGMLASFNLFLIALVTVFPIQLRHMTAEATEDASSTPSLTMIQGHESASVNLLVSSSTGTFATSSADQLAEFSVASSNQSGYTLTIVGNDDEGALKDSNTNNALSTITDKTSISAFDNSIFNGKWGYRPSKYNSVANEDFYPSPTTEASTLDKTNQPNQETPNVYTIGLGARADYSTSAGSYTGSYTLQAIGNVVPYTIYFVDDTNDSTVANLPTSIIGSTQDSTITLPSTLPTRTGYTFGGWCSTSTTLDASGNSVCSGGTLYDRGGEFPISQLSSSESTLHATWMRENYNVVVKFQGEGVESVTFSASGRPSQTVSTSDDTVSLAYGIEYTVNANTISDDYELVGWGINNPNYGALSSMTSNPTTFTPNENSGSAELTAVGKLAISSLQEMVIQDCPATPTLVYDTRDNEKYYIQKLADGNCWMLDNLRLGSDTEIELTPQDTNITTNYTLPASVKGGTATNAIALLNADYKNDDTKRYYGEGSGKLGVFYNYCASSAGGFCVQASSSGASFTQPDYDICPKGWRLPTGGTTGEYQDLYTAYSNDSITFLTALSMPFSGYYSFSSSGSLEYPNSYGYLRPSTLLNATSASVVYSAYPSTVILNSSSSPYNGNPIRCILKTPLEDNDITTMQAVGKLDNASKKNIQETMPENVVASLKDERDNKKYKVAKLADGNIWMVSNLSLGGSYSGGYYLTTDLTESNTNLKNPITASTYNSWQKTSGISSNSDGSQIPNTMINSAVNETYGTLYNYCAASAGTVCTENSDIDAKYDICPVGWRLPTGGEDGEFSELYNSYSTYDLLLSRINAGGAAFSLSGYSNGSSFPTARGTEGRYWASTHDASSFNMNSAYLYETYGNFATSSELKVNQSIRCILNIAPEYIITLENISATTVGSTSTTAVQNMTSAEIINPLRQYSVSGFSTLYNNASGASVSSTSNLTSSYPLEGWYTSSTSGTKIIANDGSFVPNTTYTDLEGRWVGTSDTTLYARWGNGSSVTLPTISKAGYTCGWTTSTNTSSIMYASGYSGLVPTANMTLYGVCTANAHSVRVDFAGSGVSSVTFTASGQTTRTVTASGDTASLIEGIQYTMTMNLSSSNVFDSWALNSSNYGTLSSTSINPTYFTPNSNSTSAVITATGKEDCSGTISGYMQNYNPSDSLCVGTVGTLTDNRDNKQYKVAKLADGNIWMLDNLALGSNSSISLTPSNTNINTNWTLPASTPSDFDSYTAAKIVNDYSDTTVTKYGEGSGKIGVYYNYCAASAGTYCYAKDTSGHNDIQYDICPKGWHIPSGGSNGEAKALYNSYSTSSQRRIAYSVALSGAYQNNEGVWGAWGQNEYSSIWTSTADNDNNIIYTMDSNGSDAGSGTANYMGARNSGLSIRCMLNI